MGSAAGGLGSSGGPRSGPGRMRSSLVYRATSGGVRVADLLAGSSAKRRAQALRFPSKVPHGPTQAWLQRNYALRLARRRPGRLVVRVHGDGQMDVDTSDVIGRVLAISGCWEPNVTSVIESLLRPGNTFVDIGAHIGYDTVLAAGIVGRTGRVRSFEPSSASFAALVANVEQNGLEWVETHQRAVSDSEGEATLHLGPVRNTGNTTLVERAVEFDTLGRQRRSEEERRTESIRTIPAENVLDGLDPSCPLVVKVDVEGLEQLVLDGLATALDGSFPEAAVLVEFTPSWNVGDLDVWFSGLLERLGLVAWSVPNGYSPEELFPVAIQRPSPLTTLPSDRSSDLVLVRGRELLGRLSSPSDPS